MKARRESSSDPTVHNSGPPCTKEVGNHSPGQGPRTFDSAGCKGRGLVYAPPRLSVCVCERMAGTEDTVFWTWAEARCQVGFVSSCSGQMLPGRGILRPLLIFLGTGLDLLICDPQSQAPPGVDSNPRLCSGAGQPANFPRPEAWSVYTRQPRALTAAPALGRSQASGEARGEAAQHREAAPASRLAKFGLRGLPAGSGTAGQGPPEQGAFARTVPSKPPQSARVTHPSRGARR